MASLLTAIGAGLVVGQGRRIEADQEATRRADEIRAQKLQEFDFQTQLQDARIKAEMKMKEMELSKETTFNMDSWINAAKTAGVSDEGIKTGGAIISQGGKPDQTLRFLTSQDYREEQKAAEKEEKIASSTKDALGEDIKAVEVKDTELSPYTFTPQLNKKVGTVLTPLASSYQALAIKEFKTETGNNKYSANVIQQMVQDATKIDDALNARTYDITDEKQQRQLEAAQLRAKELIRKYESGEVPGIDAQDFARLLIAKNPETARKVAQVAKEVGSSSGGEPPAPVNQSGGGEVQGTVMPNKPQSSLPPIEGYQEGAIIRSKSTGTQFKLVNGQWTQL